jgi:hypothetical protein
LDLQYALIMDFESTTRIRDSLLDIKETILDWDDGPLQNDNLRETCKDIYETCCTVIILYTKSITPHGTNL